VIKGIKESCYVEVHLLELEFDLNEMQEIFTMSTNPYVKSVLISLIDELRNRMKNIRCDLTENLGTLKKMVRCSGLKEYMQKRRIQSKFRIEHNLTHY